jgi:prepilin-type N-terminal cleavage/methylation domain-containing protein
MLNKLKKLQKTQSTNEGFTIIEVMIVLAIAGLILLIVFLAVPALQRNSRNTQRKSDASKLASLVSEYVSNNAGVAPAYIGTGTATGTVTTSGENFSILTIPASSTVNSYSTSTTAAPDTFAVMKGATCNGNAAVSATSARSIVIIYGLEGTVTQGCVSAN